VLALFARWVPESPAFLHQRGRQEDAQLALELLARRNGRLTPEVQELVRNLQQHRHASPQQQGVGLSKLCSRSLRWRVAVVCALWACTAVGSDFWFWITELGKARGVPRHQVEGLLVVGRIVGICGFLSAATCARYIDGLKLLFGASAACALIVFFMSALAITPDAPSVAIVSSMLLLQFAYDMVWSLLYATTVCAFDAACRISALSLASACSRVGATIAPLIAGNLIAQTSNGAFLFWATGWTTAAIAAFSLIRMPQANPVPSSEGVGASACDDIDLDALPKSTQ